MPNQFSDAAKTLAKRHNLSLDPNDGDVFISHQFKIITRQGIDKITAAEKINSKLTPLFIDPYEVVYLGEFTTSDGKRTITTTGSASIDRVEVIKLSQSRSGMDKEASGPSSQSREIIETVLLKKGNVKQNPPYLSEMAEKRCNSRGVLKLSGWYDEGFYGEDEADDFQKAVRESKKSSSSSVKSKKL